MTATTTPWDYSALAPHYELRAAYADQALDALLTRCDVAPGAAAVDIGAGTGRLTRWLARRGHPVDAVEPCAPMRTIGSALCAGLPVRWHARDGIATGLGRGCAGLVSYGSSFNVLSPQPAIDEALRLLGGSGKVLLVWNHRDLSDPVQQIVESLIRAALPAYVTGSRRADPMPDWRHHAQVLAVDVIEAPLLAEQTLSDFVAGFRAHATLVRQIGDGLDALLADMQRTLAPACPDGTLRVPFHTRAWCLTVTQTCN